jgi:prepilin-type N-terminal cleavage/methylation domain-containing protein
VRLKRDMTYRRGRGARPGFTLVEVLFVVLIVGILGGVTVPKISAYTSHRSAVNARDAFIRTAALARAAAIQTGDQVEMRVNPAGDSVVVVTAASDTVGVLDLRTGAIRSNLSGSRPTGGAFSTAGFRVCYVPRGYARPTCGGAVLPREVTFISPGGGHTATAVVSISQVGLQ